MQQSSATPQTLRCRERVEEDSCSFQSSSQCLLVSTVFGMVSSSLVSLIFIIIMGMYHRQVMEKMHGALFTSHAPRECCACVQGAGQTVPFLDLAQSGTTTGHDNHINPVCIRLCMILLYKTLHRHFVPLKGDLCQLQKFPLYTTPFSADFGVAIHV